MEIVTKDKEVQFSNTQNKRDRIETSLHIAALHDRRSDIPALICQGEDVNATRNDGKTPLMLAIACNNSFIATFLLDYGANIAIADDNGETALKLAFKMKNISPLIIRKFLQRLQLHYPCVKELTDVLFEAGCTLYYATFLKDAVAVGVLEGLLERGVRDVNSKFEMGQTVLHIAVKWEQLNLVSCLLNAGANTNALDDLRRGPLYIAAELRNPTLLRLLLERNADPNVKIFDDGLTPLHAVFRTPCLSNQRNRNECAKLLLQYGAVPSQKIGNHPTLLDQAITCNDQYQVDLLICYAALKEMQGVRIAEIITQFKGIPGESALKRMQKHCQDCLRILMLKVFEDLTLLDLLSANRLKLRIHLSNNDSFHDVINEFLTRQKRDDFGRNSESLEYYYDTLKDRLEEAALEQKAVSALCQIFRSNYNMCHIFADQILGYLRKLDLESLCRI